MKKLSLVFVFVLVLAMAISVFSASAAVNLVDGALDAAKDAGDKWSAVPGCWWGPRQAPDDACGGQLTIENVDDGLNFFREDDEDGRGLRCCSIQYNTESGLLEAGKTYDITIKYLATAAEYWNGDSFALSTNVAGAPYADLTADGEWHTATITVTMPSDYAADGTTTIALSSTATADGSKTTHYTSYCHNLDVTLSEFTVCEAGATTGDASIIAVAVIAVALAAVVVLRKRETV